MSQIFMAHPDPGAGSGGSPAAQPYRLRFTPYDTTGGKERYLACYRDAWRIAHGIMAGFDPEACWKSALIRASENPDALTAAWLGDTFAGVLALDTRRSAWRGRGWIAFCYIVPDLRNNGYGRDLVRKAEEVYRALGRKTLRLTVAPRNPALNFYKKLGYRAAGTERGALEDLIVMEKEL